MKKRIERFALITLILFIAVLPVTATDFTRNTGNSASMDLTYTVAEPAIISSYVILIPGIINLNERGDFVFFAEDVTLPSNQKVVVRIDDARTFDSDGIFHL
jgi:hypothetical protein